LPGTVAELNQVRETLNGASSDQMLSVAFTRHAVMDPRIKNYRIVHFATHGLLPSDIECQTEAAIVMSASPGAESAGDALLTASQIARLQFNADAVILSACNSGGPEGKTGGESLSGLARSFFFAGARALLVTHWEVNDQVTRILVAGTMKNFIDTPGEGLASALVREERDILTQAVGDNAEFAHPYYWSPLALIGDGGARTALATH
jgi:CHAT domain-containing protein